MLFQKRKRKRQRKVPPTPPIKEKEKEKSDDDSYTCVCVRERFSILERLKRKKAMPFSDIAIVCCQKPLPF